MSEIKTCEECSGEVVIERVGENNVPVCQDCGLIEEEGQMAQYYKQWEVNEGVVEEV